MIRITPFLLSSLPKWPVFQPPAIPRSLWVRSFTTDKSELPLSQKKIQEFTKKPNFLKVQSLLREEKTSRKEDDSLADTLRQLGDKARQEGKIDDAIIHYKEELSQWTPSIGRSLSYPSI
ncbi:MAG: hypothetical protein K1000chlam2_00970 [Chlamydiae bacterium]|nr:hypothetical protein [Chlamydiota bacterium]